MSKYLVCLYNQKVREAIDKGHTPNGLSSAWADNVYLEVDGPNIEMVRQSIMKQYPTEQGFVIVDIVQFNLFD